MNRPLQTTCSYCSYSIRFVMVRDLAAELDCSNEAAGPLNLHHSSSVACPMQVAARTSAAVAKGFAARGLDWAAAPITDTDSSSAALAAHFIVEMTCTKEVIVKQATTTVAEEFDTKKRRLVELNIG